MNRSNLCNLAFLTLLASASTASGVERLGFDGPHNNNGWVCGSIGGSHRGQWTVKHDPTAPSPPNVLKVESGRSLPWCVRENHVLIDGFAEVSVKPVFAHLQKGVGLIWRWQSANSFYGAHLNLDNSILSITYVEKGRALLLRKHEIPPTTGAWHVIRVDFKGANISVKLNRNTILEFDDYRNLNAGAVGIWAASDSAFAFDDFSYGVAQ